MLIKFCLDKARPLAIALFCCADGCDVDLKSALQGHHYMRVEDNDCSKTMTVGFNVVREGVLRNVSLAKESEKLAKHLKKLSPEDMERYLRVYGEYSTFV